MFVCLRCMRRLIPILRFRRLRLGVEDGVRILCRVLVLYYIEYGVWGWDCRVVYIGPCIGYETVRSVYRVQIQVSRSNAD